LKLRRRANWLFIGGYHFENGHDGSWQTCPTCREEVDAEMYGYYGTNEFNFERLDKVPEFEPVRRM